MTNHGLSDEHGYVLASVVHCDGVTEHVGDNHRAAGPSLDNVLGALLVLSCNLYEKVLINERALLQTTRHVSGSLALLASTTATNNELVAFLVGATGTTLGLTVGVNRVTAT